MKKNKRLLIVLLVCMLMPPSVADAECTATDEEIEAALAAESWEGIWHTHDDSPHEGISGEHFHRTHRDVITSDGCLQADIISDYEDLHSGGPDPPPTDNPLGNPLTDDDDTENPRIEQQPTSGRPSDIPTHEVLPSTRQPQDPEIQEPETQTQPQPQTLDSQPQQATTGVPQTQQPQTVPEQPQLSDADLLEIADGERAPVETIDPTTGETIVIDCLLYTSPSPRDS